ncbi:MAG: ATP-binding cassette domain-containing protein [Steroidobacteraceae bacterium]
MRPRLSISLHEAGVRRDGRWALEDVNLDLRGGERWVLTGPNGAGKTHLLKLLSTQLWPTPTGRERRRFVLGRRVLDEGEAKPMLAYLGAEAQDRYARRDWNLEVRALLVAAVQGTDLPLEAVTPAQRRRVATLLREAGLQPLARRRFLTLSYGQKRLVLMARCLARRPHWLLLDEPYNGLDARWRARLDALLARARRHGTGWVVSAHRRADVPAGTPPPDGARAGQARAPCGPCAQRALGFCRRCGTPAWRPDIGALGAAQRASAARRGLAQRRRSASLGPTCTWNTGGARGRRLGPAPWRTLGDHGANGAGKSSSSSRLWPATWRRPTAA